MTPKGGFMENKNKDRKMKTKEFIQLHSILIYSIVVGLVAFVLLRM
jgi:hypothetical protein